LGRYNEFPKKGQVWRGYSEKLITFMYVR